MFPNSINIFLLEGRYHIELVEWRAVCFEAPYPAKTQSVHAGVEVCNILINYSMGYAFIRCLWNSFACRGQLMSCHRLPSETILVPSGLASPPDKRLGFVDWRHPPLCWISSLSFPVGDVENDTVVDTAAYVMSILPAGFAN
ncbi:hypothetical protein TcWFU_002104 [Taenia crassiceps]|uniref:Uncharacterized protein n=1 Tax=Taenia crassiceps TaxID=6207 RepID=A0ABR4QD08_9CEST